jgi:hypothetical protein
MVQYRINDEENIANILTRLFDLLLSYLSIYISKYPSLRGTCFAKVDAISAFFLCLPVSA